MKSGPKLAPSEIYALVFGLFLGLCILKFGNPVILDQRIDPPASLSEAWRFAWPTHWANWIFFPLAAVGAVLIAPTLGARQPPHLRWLLVLPLLWLGWQFLSATQTVDDNLTAITLWQFSGCVASYYIGVFLFRNPRARQLFLIGVL